MFNTLRTRLARLRDEEGQTLIEYALIATLVAIAAIVMLAAVGIDLEETLNEVENVLGGDAEAESTPPAGDNDAEPSA